MKYWELFKDLFIVFDEYKESGWRLSEAMIANMIVLVSSALVLIFGVDLGLTDLETGAVATGIMSVVGIILRLRSKGGEIKIGKDNG